MQELTIEIEIDEHANIKAETKNMKGKVCIDELNNILKGLHGATEYQNKPEYYQENNNINKLSIKRLKTNDKPLY